MIAICALGWNKAEYTRAWIDSVWAHSGGHDINFFLMDNGSTDGGATTRVMQGAHFFARNEENESIHKGWNRLLREALARGAEHIILSNNDLVCGPGWLDAAVRELCKNDKRYFLPNGDFRPEQFASACQPAATKPNARAGWCLMFTADAVREFLPIPEELVLWYGDDYVHHKLGKAGYRCETICDCLVFHHGSVSFYTRPGYVEIVAKDRAWWENWLAQQEKTP